jgi:hypothetical protein
VVLTKREIGREINKIYRERKSWSTINKQLNYKIPEKEVHRRELVLLAQYTLYKIEDAKKEKNKRIASFNSELYGIIKEHI